MTTIEHTPNTPLTAPPLARIVWRDKLQSGAGEWINVLWARFIAAIYEAEVASRSVTVVPMEVGDVKAQGPQAN